MANAKISEFPAGGAPQATDEIPAARAGLPVKLAVSAFATQAELDTLDTEKSDVGHAHAGEDITSGTVADARIASTIARDSEVTAAVAAVKEREEILALGLGLKGWTYNKGAHAAFTAQTSGDLIYTACGFRAGDTITTLHVLVLLAGSGVTLAKLGVYTAAASNVTRLGVTADFSASVTSKGVKSVALVTPYVVPADAMLYLATVQVGTTPARYAVGVNGDNAYTQAIGSGLRQAGRVSGQTDLPVNSTILDYSILPWFGWS